ncbi:MAG: GIY-YIG nuclease family protein [Bacteroidales bacterium]|nr:GIY-YIG nuclease family protein [Bacteroidales bacterium]
MRAPADAIRIKPKHYVYILQNKEFRKYTGYTQNLNDRLNRHNSGYVAYTKPYRPWKLITYIVFEDKYKAIEFEKYLKSGSGRAFANKRLI